MDDNINKRECEILKAIPKSQVLDFVEKNGQRMRDLIQSDDDFNDTEIIEMLLEGYKGM